MGPIDEVEGVLEELIKRLAQLLDGLSDRSLSAMQLLIVLALGGRLNACHLDPGHKFAEGSVGARMKAQGIRFVSRREYVVAVRDRLAELVLDGLGEAFLVRSMIHEISRHAATLQSSLPSKMRTASAHRLRLVRQWNTC